MKSFQQLSQEIIDIIKATNNYFIGNTSGMNNDGTVNVHHPKGYSVNAIAANPISSGEVIVFNVNNTWYAFGEQRTVVKEDVLIQRKSRAKKIEVYPVKTLYIIYKNSNPRLLQVYLGGDDASKKIHEESGYFYGIIGYLNRISLEGYLSFDGKDTISQLDFVDWYDIYIKINNNPITYIQRWYSDWNPTFNLGMGTLEYTDDLLLNPPKRVIKRDEEIQIGMNLEKYRYLRGSNLVNNPDPQFSDLQGKHGFDFVYIAGTIETPRKDGTISTCSLSTDYDIEFDTYELLITIGCRGNITHTFTRPDTPTITFTQDITSTSTPIFSYRNTRIRAGSSNIVSNYIVDLTETINKVNAGLHSNLGTSGGDYYPPYLGDDNQLIGLIVCSQLEPFADFENNNIMLDNQKGYYKYRMGYLGKKSFVDLVDAEGGTFTDANKTTFTLPGAVETYVDSGYSTTVTFSDLSTSSHVFMTMDYKKNQHITYTIQGTVTVVNTTDGEIYQEYQGTLELWNNDEVLFDDYYKVRYRYTTQQLQTLKEQTNIIKLQYGTRNITLNTGDFGVINLKGGNGTTDVVISPITMDSESFTITLSNKIKFTKFFNILSVGDAQVGTFKEFDPTSFQGNFLMGYEINNKEVLIKGVITDLPVYNDGSPFVIECTITNIKSTPTSFKNHLIMDNGSFYNYWFRKFIPLRKLGKNSINEDAPWYSVGSDDFDFNMIINKSILPTIPLNGTFHGLFFSSNSIEDIQYNYLENLAFTATINNRTDNIKGNKIYSVVKAEGSKAWIEQWNIFDNGDVKYNKVFQVDYVPLKKPKTDEGEAIAILAHSYYPK